MVIEWEKIKSEPTKIYKIPGQDLLNLKEQVESQHKNIEGLTIARDELSAKIDSFEKKMTGLETEIKSKDEQLSSLEAFSNELKKQHARESKAKEQRISELENSVSNKEEEIKRLKEEILSRSDEISELQAKANEITVLQNRISELQAKDNEIIALQDRISELQAKANGITALQNKISKLQDGNSELITEISKMQDQISAKESEIGNLKKETAETTSRFENEVKSLKSRVDELQGIIKAKEDSLGERDRKIDELNVEMEELKQQIPKKPVFEKAEEVSKGASCPKCGIPTLEEYKIVEGKRQLIRKYCPNPSCGWTIIEKPEIAITVEAEAPKVVKKEIKIFQVKKDGLEEKKTLNSKMVAIIADPGQDIIWIWKGKDSSRFEYAEATRQATRVKMEIVKIFHARIERVDEGKEPENFPKF